MDSIFGRRKQKQRQSSLSDLNDVSVPYDKVAPSSRSPLPVGTVSQGLRGGPLISAPTTNPTLSQNGTELNKRAMQNSRAEREQTYANYGSQHSFGRPQSPNTSFGTDSSTLANESFASSSTGTLHTPTQSRSRRSEASSSHSRGSSIVDLGQSPYQTPSQVPGSPSHRPTSGMTTRSDGHRGSRYAPSFDGGSHQSHLSQFYPHRPHESGGDFPRPDTDEEINALFENVMRTRGVADNQMKNLSIEQKWHMVYNDWQIRYKEEKENDQARRHNETSVQSPEWFIQKFLQKTITQKQAGILNVSLRSKDYECVESDST